MVNLEMVFSTIKGLGLWAILLLIVVILIARTIRIVPQSYAYVITRLGSYHTTLNAGVHIIVPFIDQVASKITIKEQIIDFPPQPVITKDNVTMQIDTVIYFQITDPYLYKYGIAQPIKAMEALAATTLRNIIGDLELDETLTSRDVINTKIRSILDEATDPWGIKVQRVEVKNIIPPRDIQEAMEKQMRAERERRQAILQAEGRKRSAVLDAEGEKTAKILSAEAEKEATILKATAQREANIQIAQGKAEAIRLVYEAQAKGIQYINEANPDKGYLTIEGFKALQELSKGQATKIIIPTELQSMAGMASSLKEFLANDQPKQ